MKKITVTYTAGGKILTAEDNSAYFDQENVSLQIDAKIETDKNVRSYIKAANGNSNVTEAIEPADSVYSVPIEDKYMSKGTLYVGFEAYDDTGYVERYEPVKVYIDSFINLGEVSSDNVYVVTVGVDSTETLAPGEQAYVENVGTKKDIKLKFGIPKGQTGSKGADGYTPQRGVDYWTKEDKGEMEDYLYAIGGYAIDKYLIYPSTQLLDANNVSVFKGYFDHANFHSGENYRTLYIPCKPNTIYYVKRKVIDNRFSVGFSADIPANNGTVYGYDCSNVDFTGKKSLADSQYLCVYYYNKNANGTLTETELLQNIQIYEENPMSEDDEPFIANVGNETRKVIKNAVHLIPTTKFMVGPNILTADRANTAAGWEVSTDATNGVTIKHTKGATPSENKVPLEFNLGGTTAGNVWLITFESEDITDDLVYLSFGDEALTQTYNGTNKFAVAIRVKANNARLKITPESRFEGTITNLQARALVQNSNEFFEFDGDVITNLNNLRLKTGFWNVVIGTEHTMTNAINSSRTIAIGHNVLHNLISGNRNIGIGTFAMQQLNDGEDNLSIGADSMGYIDSAARCTAVGVKAMTGHTERVVDNVAIGTAAGKSGNRTVSVGSYAGVMNNGDDNVFVGCHAGENNKTGSRNILIGSYASGQPTGDFNTIIGRQADYPDGATNCVVIGKAAKATKSNQVVIGNEQTEEVILGNRKLKFNVDGTVSWRWASDTADNDDEVEIVDITSTLGISAGRIGYTGDVVTNGGIKTEAFTVNAGEKYLITSTYTQFWAMIAEYDENDNFIRAYPEQPSENVSVVDYEYVVPEGVEKIVVSHYSSMGAITVKRVVPITS